MYEASVLYMKNRLFFQCVIIFVGVGFERTLIASVASGALSCDVVITQSREHIYVSPVCFLSPGTRPGVWGSIVRRVP